VTWTETALPPSILYSTSIAHGIVNGNMRFVVVSGNKAVFSGDGGETWTETTMPDPNGYWAVEYIPYGNGRFVAISSSNNTNKAAYSDDGGETWTETTLPYPAQYRGIAYSGSRLVVVAINTTRGAYSDDGGVTWTNVTLPSTQFRYLTYGNGRFVAVTMNDNLSYWSLDGINWATSYLPSVRYWWNVIYANNIFVAVAIESDAMAYSYDAINWIPSTPPSTSGGTLGVTSIAYGNGRLVAFDYSGNVYYLDLPLFTGKAFAKTVNYKRYINGEPYSDITKSLLTDVVPPLTESEYAVLYESEVEGRVKAIIASFKPDGTPEYLTEPIIDDGDCAVYIFIFNNGTSAATHNIGYNETFTDTIISTKSGEPVEYTVLSKPAWATVAIDGNTATVTSNNDGAYREGTIVYQQSDSEIEITSEIKQYGQFNGGTFSLGINKASEGTQHYPGIPPEDYSVSFDFEMKIAGVTVTTGSRSLPVGSTSTVSQSNANINGYNYPKTVDIYLTNLQVNVPNKTATIVFIDEYGINWKYITEVNVTPTSVYIKVEDKGGSLLGGFVIGPVVTVKEIWRAATMPSSSSWNSVAYGNGRFVAVAYGENRAAYSDDGGETWNPATMPSSSSWRSIAYGGGRFVAVAYNSDKSAWSDDGGETWNAQPLPSTAYWRSIAYGNGRFVAVAYNSDKSAWSDDGGETWNEETLPSTAGWDSIAYGGGRFVAVADISNKSAWSDDGGETWNEETLPSVRNRQLIAYGGGRFVAVADSSDKSDWSDDGGETWNEETLPSTASWRSIAYGGGRFVAVADNSDKSAWSDDGGETWNEETLPSTAYWRSIAYGGGRFVAVVYNNSNKTAYMIYP
jgi:hypothetical protein